MNVVSGEYKNQTVVGVSLEAYFKGRLGVYAGFERIQQIVGDRFPNLFVPNALHGEHIALKPFQLRNREGSEVLGIALNQASYTSRKYPGFVDFREKALHHVRTMLNELRVPELARLVFRYDNELLIDRESDGTIPLGRVLRVYPACEQQPPRYLNFTMESVRYWHRGRLHTSVGASPDASGAERLRFSIAAEVTPGGPVEQLDDMTDASHDEARGYFEQLITDDFRAWLKGRGENEESGDAHPGDPHSQHRTH